jgi:hypothetical protein
LSREPQLAGYVEQGLISPVPMYRIISHFSKQEDRARVAKSLLGLGDEEIKQVLKCLKDNPQFNIEECKRRVAERFSIRSLRLVSVTVSKLEYDKLRKAADERKTVVPIAAKEMIEEWVAGNLPGAYSASKKQSSQTRQVGGKFVVSFPLSYDLQKAVSRYARIMGKRPAGIIESALRKKLGRI